MHTLIVPHLSAYSEYGSTNGCWFMRRTVNYAQVCWC